MFEQAAKLQLRLERDVASNVLRVPRVRAGIGPHHDSFVNSRRNRVPFGFQPIASSEGLPFLA
jgi:hypothetical protein